MILEIRLERIKHRMKMHQVATALNVDIQKWGRIERGGQDVPADVAQRAAALFGKPTEQLFKAVNTRPLALAGSRGDV